MEEGKELDKKIEDPVWLDAVTKGLDEPVVVVAAVEVHWHDPTSTFSHLWHEE